MKNLGIVRVAACAIALSMGMGACSSSGSEGATTATSQLPTGEPIKLMINFSSQGFDANPQIVEGAQAAVEAINNAGGVQGRPLELIPCDNNNDPNQAAACGNQAVSEGVVATVGGITQQSTSYMPILASNNIAALGQAPANAADFTSPAAFPIDGGAVSGLAGLGRFVADEGAKTIALVRPDIASGGAAAGFVNNGLAPVGLSVSNDVAVPADAPDMSSYAASALSGGTDGVVVALGAQQAINVVRSIRQSDPDVAIGLAASDLEEVASALGADAEGIVLAEFLLIPSVDAPGNEQYRAEMKAAGYDELGSFRNASWLSVHLFAEVASRLSTITSSSFLETLGTVTDLPSALTPPLQFTTGGVGGIPRVFNGCVYPVRLSSDGAEEPATGQFFDPFANAPCPTPGA